MAGSEEAGERIVVGVDGSESARRALRWAARQAGSTGAALEAVIAWEPPFAGTGSGLPAGEGFDPEETARRALAEDLDKVLGAHPPARLIRRVGQGTPEQVLMTAAAGASLLVVGSRGLGGFTGSLLGSVSQYCAQHAPCPVVIVRGREG